MKKTWGKIWQGLVFLLRHRGSAACPLAHTICVTCKPGTGSYIWGGAPSREETRLSPRDYFCFLKFSPFFERRKIYVYSLLGFFFKCKYFGTKVSSHPAQSRQGAPRDQWVTLHKTLSPRCCLHTGSWPDITTASGFPLPFKFLFGVVTVSYLGVCG